MLTVVTMVPLVLRRALAYWRLLVPVLLGAVLATAITSSVVIYFDALREMGLRHALKNVAPEEFDLRLALESPTALREDQEAFIAEVENRVGRDIGWLVERPTLYGKSSTFFVRRPGEPPVGPGDPLDKVPRGSFHTLTGAEEHIDLIAGKMPAPVAATREGPLVVEALAFEQTAAAFPIVVDEEVVFAPFWEDRADQVRVVITGVARPRGEGGRFWFEETQSLTGPPSTYNHLPLLVPQETLLDGLAPSFTRLSVRYVWLYPVETERLHVWNASAALGGLREVGTRLVTVLPHYRQTTELTETLFTYDTRLRFIQVPLTVVLLLIAAVVLYAVVFLASLVVERQREDVALLRSRGARRWQIFVLYAFQGLLIGGIAVVVGPLVAAPAIAGLGLSPFFLTLSGGLPLSVTLSTDAYQMSLLGGLLAFGVLLFPAAQAARHSVTEERRRRARPGELPFYQRYYLDVGLGAATAVLLWQLGQRGSLLEGALAGRTESDLFLLFVPVGFLLALSLLFLRVFPLLMGLLGRLLAPVAPAWVVLGLWELGRNPVYYTRLVLLLTLAASLGSFASSFGGTLERNYRERALYKAGAELRITGASLSALDGPLAEKFPRATLISRQPGSVLSGSVTGSYEFLAVEPDVFADVAWWRGDFAQEPLSQLLERLGAEESPPSPRWGIPLPAEAKTIAAWVQPLDPSPITTLYALAADSRNRYFVYPLGLLDKVEWRLLQADLSKPQLQQTLRGQPPPPSPQAPLRFMGLYVMQPRTTQGMRPGAFLLDSVQIGGADGGEGTLVGMDDLSPWGIIEAGPQAESDTFTLTPSTGRNGGPAAVLLWSESTAVYPRGVYIGPDEHANPVLVSEAFLRGTGHRIGDRVLLSSFNQRFPARIVGSVSYFPSLDPGDDLGFVIANVNDVVRQTGIQGGGAQARVSEVWMGVDPQADRASVVDEVRSSPLGRGEVTDRASLLGTSKADPLVAAGWEALLSVAYVGVLGLGVVGFVVHAIVSSQQRQGQFALLRTMGIGRRHLQAVVWIEHLVTVGAGLLVGHWLGSQVGTLLMPFLDRTEEGIRVLPPFVMEVNWPTLLFIYGLMALVFGVVVTMVAALYNRLALGRVLRMGEE
ncbi:MAG: ABC transporter permease [Chloroflexi bacterium]|nr:ABC transporter permease [Chloroflexota bacterium]